MKEWQIINKKDSKIVAMISPMDITTSKNFEIHEVEEIGHLDNGEGIFLDVDPFTNPTNDLVRLLRLVLRADRD